MTIDSSLSSIFPAPWQDRVSQQVPITITDALYWCEYVALANQHLASALRKLAAFFVTEVRVMGAGSEEERIKDFLYDVLNIENVLNSIALDYLVYGNAFVTIFNPVERVVSCPRCKFGTLFLPYASRDDTKFRFQGGKFHLYCVKCHYVGPWDTYTVSNTRPEDINIIRWNVHDILIDDDLFSGKCRYTMRAPQAYVAKIKSGGPLQLAHIPDEFLTAALTDQHFVFNDDAIIHIKEPALAGLQMGGWGLSPILANFRQTWYIEVLRRANMAVAYDYIVPLRIIAPEPRSVGPEFGDPTLISNMSSVSSSLQAIIADWRQDPTGWYSCPFPIRYQVMGAEAGKVMPAPLIEQGNRDLIAGLSLPVEFFYGNLAMNAAPMALRLLEGTWSSISRILNYFLSRLAAFLSRQFNWDSFQLKLARPSHVDDINRQMARLQLAMNNIISMTSGLESIGISFREETRRRMEEQQFLAEESEKLQQQMQSKEMNELLSTPQEQAGQGVGPMAGPMGPDMAPMGGAPQPGGGAPPPQGAAMPGAQQDPVAAILASVPELTNDRVSPQDMLSAADQISQQLFQLDPSLRKSALLKIKTKNQLLHSLVLSRLQDIEQSVALQAKVQARQSGNRQLI